MLNIALLRLMSHQLELMVDELERMDEDLSSHVHCIELFSKLNQLIIDLNESSATIDKLISKYI